LADAIGIASDRLVVTYPGATSQSVRGDAVLTIGSTQTAYSYPGGLLTDRPIALVPVAAPEASGLAFFRSEAGLYVALALAFVGIGLTVYALGALFASGETSLQRLIDRYSGEGDGLELDDEEQAVVQTAFVQRAVEFSESFAEDRGFLSKIEELLERAKLPLRPGEAMSIYVVAVIISSILGFIMMGGVLGMAIFAMLGGVIMIVVVRMKASRRIKAFEKQLPDTLQLLAGTLRAGYSLPQGLEAVSNEIVDPMGYELRRVMTEARLGREIEDALGATAERLSSPDFAWAVMAIGIQREVGGNLNELLMTVSDTMIARERLKGEVAALTAEGKMSAIILGGLPPGLGFVMWIMNPGYINPLFSTTLGNIFLGAGVVMATIGMIWMKKVITINV
jgi:tight adherence protein B